MAGGEASGMDEADGKAEPFRTERGVAAGPGDLHLGKC